MSKLPENPLVYPLYDFVTNLHHFNPRIPPTLVFEMNEEGVFTNEPITPYTVIALVRALFLNGVECYPLNLKAETSGGEALKLPYLHTKLDVAVFCHMCIRTQTELTFTYFELILKQPK